MVDVLGHAAMGLVWAVPAWFLWDRRPSLSFVGFVLLTVMLPDVDLYLPGVPHHGVTHTILFVAVGAVVAGALVAPVATPALRRWWDGSDEGSTPSVSTYLFVTSALLVGGLSHVFIDMLSAGTGGNPPLEPFWPFFEKSVSIDFIYYSSFAWNGGLFLAALAVHLALFALDADSADRSG